MSLLEPAAPTGPVGFSGLSGLGFDDVDDDPEILRAALDFIEACDASDASDELEPFDCFSDGGFSSDDKPLTPPADHSEASVSASASSASVSASASAVKPRVGTRNRRKEEIAELRKRVVELEAQLAGTKRKLQWPESLELLSDDLPLNSASADAVWSHIARRQQQQRQHAEMENVRLRNMVTQQLSVARDLTHVAKRRALVMDTIGNNGSEQYESLLTAADRENMAKVAVGEASNSNESPLLVKIYPSRPMGVRVGAGGKSLTSTDSLTQLLGGLSIGQPAASASAPAESKSADTERVWTPSATWQSPKTLLKGLLTPHQSEPLNLRLLRLAKRAPVDDDRDTVKAGGDAMQDMVSLGTSISSRALQRASHRITTCL